MSFNKAASIKEQKGNFDEVPDDSPDEEEGEEENKKESHRQQLAKVPMIPDEDPIVCEILSLMFRQRYVLKKD